MILMDPKMKLQWSVGGKVAWCSQTKEAFGMFGPVILAAVRCTYTQEYNIVPRCFPVMKRISSEFLSLDTR